MKVGTEDKKKTIIALVLFAFAVAAVVYELWPSASSPAPAVRSAAATSGTKTTNPVFSKLDPSLRLDLLKGSEDVTYAGSGRDIFHAQAEPPKEDLKVGDVRTPKQPEQPQPHTNPPIPLKFYGFTTSNNKKQIFLSQGEDVFVAKEGDIVKGRYKVVHVNPNSVEIQDVLGNYSQQIPLTMPNS